MKRYCYFFTLFIPFFSQAHFIPTQETPLTINANLATTWRSHNVVDEYEYWQVPGTIMGGDAWPAEKGIQVDEMKLGLGVRIDPNTYGIIEVGTHASGSEDHSAIDLENAYLGYVCCEDKGPWVVEVGRMTASFTPSLSTHATNRLASESALVTDVFFGRNFHDEGARVMWHTDSLIAGAEVWKGNAFPATSSAGGAWDVFARYQWNNDNLSLTSGAWLYRSSADTRSDHRYGGSHQHTPVASPGKTVAVFPDTRFTGDTDLFGIHVDLSYVGDHEHWEVGFKTEVMALQMDGMLHDAVGRAADIDSNQIGAWAQPYVRWQTHTFGIRSEWLTSDNEITGPAANQLSIDSGMANPTNVEPSRYSAIWVWQWQKNIALRTEVIEDNSLPEDTLRFGIGIIWKQTLWPFNGSAHRH